MTQPLPPEMFECIVTPKHGFGYIIEFTTWENDADHYSTQQLAEVKTMDDVNFWIALGKSFASCNSRAAGHGNEDIDHATLVDIVKQVLEQHPALSQDVVNEFHTMFGEECEGELHDYLYVNMLGSPVDYDYNFCRVVEKIDVRLIQPMCVEVMTMRC